MSEQPVRIILSDNREFHAGQEVEVNFKDGIWRKRIIDVFSTRDNVSLNWIAEFGNSGCVRAIAPKVKRPMTAKEVWSLLQTGVEWRYHTWDKSIFKFGGIVCDRFGNITIEEFLASGCTYRIAPDQPWQKFEVEV